MTRSQKSQDGGFVLISALVAVGVLSLLGATIASMAITSKNAEEKWVLRDRSASLAQSGLEKTRWDIYEKFYEYYNSSPNAQMPSKFDWFNTITVTTDENGNNGTIIGVSGYTYEVPDEISFVDEYIERDEEDNIVINGITPELWTNGVYSATLTPYKRDDYRWDVLISVTAKFVDSEGETIKASTRTVEELVTYESAVSDVFGYAYFINNHGWFYGSTIRANGPIRSNGDFNMKYGPTVNGDVYASVNEDNGAAGEVYGSDYSNFSNDYYNSRTYISDWARPSIPGDYKIKNNHGHGNNVDGVDMSNPGNSKEGEDTDETVDDENKGTVTHEPLMMFGYDDETKEYENEKQIDMPMLGDLSSYKDLAKSMKSKIEVWNSSTEKYEEVTTDGVYLAIGPDGIEGTDDDGVGPDGVAGTPDDGVLVLVGDTDHPIKVDGPVVVENDLIIRGVYTGQGTIYSGRNVHIVGNIVADDPPVWNRDMSALDTADVEKAFTDNEAKDLLCLAAKGNVMLGDVDSIKNSSYIQPPFTKPYTTDPTDYDIGYAPNSDGKWDGDYTGTDGGKRAVEATPGLTGTLRTYYNSKTVSGSGTNFLSELSVGDEITLNGRSYDIKRIDSNTQLTLHSKVYRNQSGIVIAGTEAGEVDRHYYEPSVSDATFQTLLEKDNNGNHREITQVDAISYTNHLYGGNIGEAVFNGSIVSRDEAILFDGSLELNWDMRAQILLPKQLKKPSTIYWRER